MTPDAFVVMYSTGEYSDRDERVVSVFLKETTAKESVERLDAWLLASGAGDNYRRANSEKWPGAEDIYESEDFVDPPPDDVAWTRSQSNGGRYWYVAVPLR